MTLNWKIIGAFSGGFALGSVISYFILKKQAEKELNEAIDREKEALQKAYEDRGAAILTAQGMKKLEKRHAKDLLLDLRRLKPKKILKIVRNLLKK